MAALDADEQRARQAGAVHGRDRIDLGERRPGLDQRLLDDVVDQLDVRTARDLGNDAAEARVKIGLARDDRRPHDATVVDDRRRGLVTRSLDREDPDHRHHVFGRSMTVVPGMRRSSPSSNRANSASFTPYDHITSASSPVSP